MRGIGILYEQTYLTMISTMKCHLGIFLLIVGKELHDKNILSIPNDTNSLYLHDRYIFVICNM